MSTRKHRRWLSRLDPSRNAQLRQGEREVAYFGHADSSNGRRVVERAVPDVLAVAGVCVTLATCIALVGGVWDDGDEPSRGPRREIGREVLVATNGETEEREFPRIVLMHEKGETDVFPSLEEALEHAELQVGEHSRVAFYELTAVRTYKLGAIEVEEISGEAARDSSGGGEPEGAGRQDEG